MSDDTEVQRVVAVSEPAPAPVPLGNEEFPVPFARFARSLLMSPDEVYITHIRIRHGRENHKPSEWRAVLEKYRNEPAHPLHPQYRG
jgi:hypothetical protein